MKNIFYILFFAYIFYPFCSFADRIFLLSMSANMDQNKYTDKDQVLFVDKLLSLYGGSRLHYFEYKNATIHNYREGIQLIKNQSNYQDKIIIYFSGHGTIIPDTNGDESNGFDEALVLYNHNGVINPKTILIDDELAEDIRQIKSKSITVILDTCFSGGMQKNLTNKQDSISKTTYLDDLYKYNTNKSLQTGSSAKGMNDSNHGVLYAASSETQTAIEYQQTNLQGGLFTLKLTSNLRTINGDIEHDLDNAFKETKKEVSKITDHRQTPQKFTY